MTNFFYFLTTSPCVSLFWAIYTKIKICAICLLTFGPTCAIIFGPQRGLVGYDVCAPHGHIFNNCPVCITEHPQRKSIKSIIPYNGPSVKSFLFVILHKIICLSSKDKYPTTAPCVSWGAPCERASRPLYHKSGSLSIGNLHKFFLLTSSL